MRHPSRRDRSSRSTVGDADGRCDAARNVFVFFGFDTIRRIS
jgi:hypothetical protein